MNDQNSSIGSKVILALVLIVIALTVWGVVVWSGDDVDSSANAVANPTLTPLPTRSVSPTGFSQPTPTPGNAETATPTPTTTEATPTPGTDGDVEGNVSYNIVVSIDEDDYATKLLRFPRGSSVEITVRNGTNSTTAHNFVIDELNVQSDSLAPGDNDIVTFTIPESAPATYTYYSSIGTDRAQGLEGTIEVVAE